MVENEITLKDRIGKHKKIFIIVIIVTIIILGLLYIVFSKKGVEKVLYNNKLSIISTINVGDEIIKDVKSKYKVINYSTKDNLVRCSITIVDDKVELENRYQELYVYEESLSQIEKIENNKNYKYIIYKDKDLNEFNVLIDYKDKEILISSVNKDKLINLLDSIVNSFISDS